MVRELARSRQESQAFSSLRTSFTPQHVEPARPPLESLPHLLRPRSFLLSPFLPTKGMFNVPLLGLSGTNWNYRIVTSAELPPLAPERKVELAELH